MPQQRARHRKNVNDCYFMDSFACGFEDALRAKPEFRSHRHLSPRNSNREQFSKLCPQCDFEFRSHR